VVRAQRDRVHVLDRALGAFYQAKDTGLLESYTATVPKRVWRAQQFSWWMTRTSGPRSASARTLFVVGALRPSAVCIGASRVVVAVTRRLMAVAYPVPAGQQV
jgi:hypothetical protein